MPSVRLGFSISNERELHLFGNKLLNIEHSNGLIFGCRFSLNQEHKPNVFKDVIETIFSDRLNHIKVLPRFYRALRTSTS
ncbi:hypothetical protein JCM19235_6158 [Vibrio maritimus]|uniref:Uncharacterized protein n=1 Tax=Vibrio maritimus TaxID=990268 RepID=A0A090RQC6_9VIBR|nr:hypothetical protein JCM19235_6158 [Vibrio maritimus]